VTNAITTSLRRWSWLNIRITSQWDSSGEWRTYSTIFDLSCLLIWTPAAQFAYSDYSIRLLNWPSLKHVCRGTERQHQSEKCDANATRILCEIRRSLANFCELCRVIELIIFARKFSGGWRSGNPHFSSILKNLRTVTSESSLQMSTEIFTRATVSQVPLEN